MTIIYFLKELFERVREIRRNEEGEARGGGGEREREKERF